MISTRYWAAAITETRTQFHTLSPTARPAKALEGLHLDTGFLDSARALAARASDLQRRAREMQQKAGQNRQEALMAVVADPQAQLGVAAQTLN
jgi:hypothetical protein